MTKLFPILLAAAALAPAPAQTENSRLLFTQVEPILENLSDITGMKIRRKVPSGYITRENLNGFLNERVKKEVKPEDIRIETLVLRMFGFIPEDYDLKKAVVDLITEQAAAFYDYDKKKLYITESDSSFLEKRAALVHELAHALADQNFSLGKYLRKGAKNDDAAAAREAVAEGQATWLMWGYASKVGGGEAAVPDYILETMTGAGATDTSAYPVLANAPLYLRQSLLFPYTAGLKFTNELVKKQGKEAFQTVYRRPPVSTQQILHPERYLEAQNPANPALPKLADEKKYRGLAQGELGELDFHVLLEQYAGKEAADRIAPHWAGGKFRLYELKQGRKPVLMFTVQWDSASTAREFFEAYREILEKKSKGFAMGTSAEDQMEGSVADGKFQVQLKGSVVTSIEGATLN